MSVLTDTEPDAATCNGGTERLAYHLQNCLTDRRRRLPVIQASQISAVEYSSTHDLIQNHLRQHHTLPDNQHHLGRWCTNIRLTGKANGGNDGDCDHHC